MLIILFYLKSDGYARCIVNTNINILYIPNTKHATRISNMPHIKIRHFTIMIKSLNNKK